jgi:hypothetical protein
LQAGGVIAQLLGMVILARLLSPSDFGVVAMAWLVTGFPPGKAQLARFSILLMRPASRVGQSSPKTGNH